MKTNAAMSEIIRVGGWGLRGLGYPFGVAERAIRFVAWAEGVHGGAIRSLRLTEELIAPTVATPAGRRRLDDGGTWHLDAASKHLLEVGPPAIDLLTSEARDHGSGRIVLDNVFGHGLLAALLDLAARRNLVSVATFRVAESDVLPKGVPGTGWIVAMPADGQTRFAVGGSELPGDVDRALSALPASLRSRTGTIRTDLQGMAKKRGGQVRLSAFRHDAQGIDLLWSIEEDGKTRSANPSSDYGQRLAAAYRDGIVMDEEDLNYLYDLERRTWAPTSERSRAQAGYGLY